MKSKPKLIIFTIITLIILIYPFIGAISFQKGQNNNLNLNKASKFEIENSILIQYEGEYTLTHQELTSRDYYFKVSKIDNRNPSSIFTSNTPPHQELNITDHKITGNSSRVFRMVDKFNNTYDIFNNSLGFNEKITISQNYTIRLNAIKFESINESEVGAYNYNSEIFDLYCNKSETYFEKDNSELISLSNAIVGSTSNPIEKAKKICDWIKNNINYDGNLNEEKGALWAYQNNRGDCSEFADLMITLLRIQSIPARKVTGIVLSASSTFEPYVGQQLSFAANKESQNFLGHAWIEYYVEDIGWIGCDPTWYQSSKYYFNGLDFYRIALTDGAWFPYSPLGYDLSEFPYIPSPVTNSNSEYSFDYNVKITILKSNFKKVDILPILILSFTIIGLVALILILIPVIIKKRRNKTNSSY